MLSPWLLVLLLSSQPPSACEDLEVCRAQALIAHAKQDFEAFHDYAWAAFRKGTPGDAELMLLLARAQSLSGRPGDALVMLERIAAFGGLPSDIAEDPEFARVRALPRWSEVSQRLLAVATAPEAATDARVAAGPPGGNAASSATSSAKPVDATAVGPAPKRQPSRPPEAVIPDTPKATPPARVASPKESSSVAENTAGATAARAAGAPLRFSTILTPSALAYDTASKRYLIADRRARRIAAIDENTGQVSTLVGALGALGDIHGMAIDAQQGDLWVVTSTGDGPTLTKIQLISGRSLGSSRISDLDAAVVALAFVPGAGLVAGDAEGLLWRIRSTGRAERLGALEYVPTALGSDRRGRLYVSAGGPRLARFSLDPFRKLGTVELGAAVASDAPFVVVGDRLHAVTAEAEGYEIAIVPIK